MVVVLPAPLGPSRASVSPRATTRSRASTASTEPNRLVSPATATAGTAVASLPAVPGWLSRWSAMEEVMRSA